MRSLALTVIIAAAACPGLGAQEPSYSRNVRPILAKYCLECHNSRVQKAGLNLETHKAMLAGGDNGAVLEPGKADKSAIVLLTEGKQQPAMPPKSAKFHPKKEEIALLRAWVQAGAKDDAGKVQIALPKVTAKTERLLGVTGLVFAHDRWLLARGVDLAMLPAEAKVLSRVYQAVDPITSLARSAKIDRVAVASGRPGASGEVTLLAVSPDKASTFWRAPLHADVILDVAFTPDGKLLATASYDTRIHLVDVATGKIQRTLKDHSDAVYGLAFSPDGKQLASVSADRAVKIWETATGKLLYTLSQANDWLYAVAWSDDGSRLAAGGVDKSIRLYAVQPTSFKLLQSVFAHDGPVQRLAFTPDSKTLVSLGQDRVVKTWDVARMVEKQIFPALPDAVLSMAVSSKGDRLALGRFDGAVSILDLVKGAKLSDVTARIAPPTDVNVTPAVGKMPNPVLTAIAPNAQRRGQTAKIAVQGKHLDQPGQFTTSIPGSSIKTAERTADRVNLEIVVPATTSLGKFAVTFKPEVGSPVSSDLFVDAFDVIKAEETGGSAVSAPIVSLPVTLVGVLERTGDADFFRFQAKAGQSLGVIASTQAIGSKLEPVLTLADAAGIELAETDRGHLGFTFEKDGAYSLGIRDRELRGGKDFFYRLHVGELPVVTSVFPLGGKGGTTIDLQIRGVFLPIKSVKASLPANPGGDKVIDVPWPKGVPMPPGLSRLAVGDRAEVQPTPGDAKGIRGTLGETGTANGELREAGVRDLWSFQAKKGKRLVIETEARPLGVRTDTFIEVLDEKGELVPRAVLRCQAKTFVTFRDHDNVTGGIRIEAWNDLAANDLLYVDGELMKILALPGHPDADCNFFTSGPRLGYLDTTPTHHANNTPMYKVTVHPPGTKFPPNGFPVFTLPYRNDDAHGAGRDSRLLFDPPADGKYLVRVRDARDRGGEGFGYRLTVRPPVPSFTVSLSGGNWKVPKGASLPISINAQRIDGHEGPIAIRFENVPKGMHLPATVISSGTFSTASGLFAEEGVQLPKGAGPITMIAEAAVDGVKIRKDVPGGMLSLGDPGDILTTTEQSEVTIQPGGQTKIAVNIQRRNGFAGRVPLDVRGLPHGVRVIDIGLNGILINENESRRVVVFEAEPWVTLGEFPFVVLARREGKNTEHAAKSVTLKVR